MTTDPRRRGTCAACGRPGHRYGRNEGMDRYDPMACINLLRHEADDLTHDLERWRHRFIVFVLTVTVIALVLAGLAAVEVLNQ